MEVHNFSFEHFMVDQCSLNVHFFYSFIKKIENYFFKLIMCTMYINNYSYLAALIYEIDSNHKIISNDYFF